MYLLLFHYFLSSALSALSLRNLSRRETQSSVFQQQYASGNPGCCFSCYPVPVSPIPRRRTSASQNIIRKDFCASWFPFIYFTLFISCFSFSRAIPSTIFFLKEFLRGELFLLFLEWIPGSACTGSAPFPLPSENGFWDVLFCCIWSFHCFDFLW